MQLSFDAEKLIGVIKQKEAIWNYKNPIYNDRELRRNEWWAVCREMVPNFDKKTRSTQEVIVTSFQRQWKVLRDGFLRALKNVKKKGAAAKPYVYHNELLFMVELYDQDYIEKEMKQKYDNSSDDNSDVADAVPVVTRRPKSKRLKKISKIYEEPPRKTPSPVPEETFIENITHYEENVKQNIDMDEDKLFLLSLLSDFRSIPEKSKLDAKFDILNVLRHYRNIERSSKGPRLSRLKPKRPRESATVSTSADMDNFLYVKCEENSSEENE